jgi:hypothetical protein
LETKQIWTPRRGKNSCPLSSSPTILTKVFWLICLKNNVIRLGSKIQTLHLQVLNQEFWPLHLAAYRNLFFFFGGGGGYVNHPFVLMIYPVLKYWTVEVVLPDKWRLLKETCSTPCSQLKGTSCELVELACYCENALLLSE